MTDKELMQLALYALGLAKSSHNMVLSSDPPQSAWRYYDVDRKLQETITALDKRLEQPEQEPFEYWNAVEGWVKIDEVRQHFDSVGCGTIYKSAGEDRVPIYTTPPQRPWVGLTEPERLSCYDLNPARFASNIEAKLQSKNT